MAQQVTRPITENEEIQKIKERKQKLMKVAFANLSVPQIIAFLIYMIIGITNTIIFNQISSEISNGTVYLVSYWSLLGRVNWFWSLGVLNTIYALVIFIYAIKRFRIIIIKQSFSTLNIIEKPLIGKKITKILEKDIQGIRMNNNKLGFQWIWSLTLIQPIILGKTILGLILTRNYSFGITGSIESLLFTMVIITLIFQILAVLIQIICSLDYLEIATQEDLYELWYKPLMKEKAVIEKISLILGLTFPKVNEKGEFSPIHSLKEGSVAFNEKEQIVGTPRSYYRFYLGIFILIWALYSLFFNGPLGEQNMYLCFIYAFILFIKSNKEDFSDINKTVVLIDHKKNQIFTSKKSVNSYEYYKINNTRSIGKTSRFAYTPARIDAFDIIFLFFMVFFVIRGWVYYISTGQIFMMVRNVPSAFLEIYIIIAILFIFIKPVESLKIESEHIRNYNIHFEGLFRAIDVNKIQNLSNYFRYRNLSKLNFGDAIKYFGDKFSGCYLSHQTVILKRISLVVIPILLSITYSLLSLFL